MDKKPSSYVLLAAAVLIAMSVVSCSPIDRDATAVNSSETPHATTAYTRSDADTESTKTRDPAVDELKSQLQRALASGGMAPDTYTEIDNKIKNFEAQGYREEALELRNLLSQLSVGGQEPPPLTPGDQTQASIIAANAVNQTNASGEQAKAIPLWVYRDGTWKPQGEPPDCPDPLVFQAPVDLDLVTSILYPGQERGDDFKPHGGFRTDDTEGPVEVTAPFDGYVWRAARFIDGQGIDYMFDIMHECGISYRLGHLGVLSPKFQAIADTLPGPRVDDSRTTEIEPVFVRTGEIIATDTQESTGFDWGVYDLRRENEASKDTVFRQAHQDEPEQAYYAVCWLDYLSADQQLIVKGLPAADGKSGKNSAYC